MYTTFYGASNVPAKSGEAFRNSDLKRLDFDRTVEFCQKNLKEYILNKILRTQDRREIRTSIAPRVPQKNLPQRRTNGFYVWLKL